MKTKTPDPATLTSEDLRWVEIVRRTVDGLAAFAETHAESCDTGWMAMHLSLEDLTDTIQIIADEYKGRLGQEGGAE